MRARASYEEAEISWQVGLVKADFALQRSHRWMERELDLANTEKERAAVVEAHIERIKRIQTREENLIADLEYYFAEADMQLAKVHPSPELKVAIADREALQGSWDVVSSEGNDKGGSGLPKSISFSGRQLNFGEHHLGVLFSLDASQTPKRLDTYRWHGDFAFGFSSIYKIEGDNLTILIDWDNGPPPKEFNPKEKGCTLLVLRRAKPKEK